MRDLTPQEHYSNARKLGQRTYNNKVSNGQIGYLPSLEGILKDADIVSQVDLGTLEIPLKKIIGTNSHLRSLSFSNDFMPIILNDSEFKQKWEAICEIHENEGIRDSIKVYEYLNWFYVIEGNKRVSVLKYFDAYSINANVTRLIPKYNADDLNVVIYYEFLKFYNETKLNSIWFTKKRSFDKLLYLLKNYNPQLYVGESKYKHFEIYIYNVFRKIYHELGGQKLPITTGDAYLEYLKINELSEFDDEQKLKSFIIELIKELKFFKKDEFVDIQTTPLDIQQSNIISTFATFIKQPKPLKIAFVYARTIETSGWTYGHELGRQYLQQIMGDQIITSYVENISEDGYAYEDIKKLAQSGNDIIFTTSPLFIKDTLKCALEFPQIKFFNCSEHQPYKHLINYFGRTYEPRFLIGLIAGSLTKTNLIGYAATSPTPEVISCINAFAIGAKMVNPYSKIIVTWTKEWNKHDKFTDADEKLLKYDVDIISNRNLKVPRDVTQKYGVYSMLCSINRETKQPEHYLAAPIWNWGIFYEKIVRNVLNDTLKIITDLFSNDEKLVNFWWGMASNVIDIYFSKTHIPTSTQKLLMLFKEMIMDNTFNPFIGPIYDNKGTLKVENDELATNDQILKMKWLIDNVEAEAYTD